MSRKKIPWQWKSFGDHSAPYITGNGIASHCKYIMNYDGFKINPNGNEGWAFIKIEYIKRFFKVPDVPSSFVLFTHNGDISVSNKYSGYLNSERITRWFAENADISHDKLIPIPLGLANAGWAHGDPEIVKKVSGENNEKTKMFHAKYDTRSNAGERNYCSQQTEIHQDLKTMYFEDYLRDLSESYFCISPKGHGIDCHRTWESLYVKTIPIVTKSLVVEEHKEMPIIILDDWSDFKNIYFNEDLYHKT